jgi:hypothetical protein
MPMTIPKNNNYMTTKSENLSKINLCLIDFIKSQLRCRSKYSNKQYSYLMKFVDSKFEFLDRS